MVPRSRAAVRHPPQGDRAIVNWSYNAWGGKYPPFDLDDEIPVQVADALGLPLFEPGMILEGGSIDVNGAGDLLTTEACLLHPNRNPRVAEGDIEARLRGFLGVEKITWLGDGIEGDDTDGHIDDISRFVSTGSVVTAVEPDAADRNHAPLQANRERLGQAFDVIELPMPRRIEQDGQRLPASYRKLLHLQRPRHRADLSRCERRPGAWPAARGVSRAHRYRAGLDRPDLGAGSFHCLTQQEPAAK